MAYRIGACQLQQLRNRAGLTQLELSIKSGYSIKMISGYENNHKRMNLEAAKSIASAIGCTIEDLYTWKKL